MTRLAAALRGSAAVLAVCGLLLQGCAEPAGYVISSDDPCAGNRQELKGVQDYFFQSIVEGAVADAVAGGLAGALIGRDAKSALIGAGAGAVAGGIGGYFVAKQRVNSDRTQLVSSVYGDLTNENRQIDNTSGIYRRLSQCRFQAAEAIKADFRAGRISHDDAVARLNKQRAWFDQDTQFAESLGAKMSERGNEYAFASNELIKDDPNAKRTLSLRQAAAAQSAGGGPAVSAAIRANQTARLRENPSASGRQVGSVQAGEEVTPIGPTTGEWTQVRTASGISGYVATRLLSDETGKALAGPARAAHPPRTQQATRQPTPAPAPPAAPAPAAPPPNDVAGVAQLTESNQLKRKAFTDQLAESKVASANAFDLEGKVSVVPQLMNAG